MCSTHISMNCGTTPFYLVLSILYNVKGNSCTISNKTLLHSPQNCDQCRAFNLIHMSNTRSVTNVSQRCIPLFSNIIFTSEGSIQTLWNYVIYHQMTKEDGSGPNCLVNNKYGQKIKLIDDTNISNLAQISKSYQGWLAPKTSSIELVMMNVHCMNFEDDKTQ